MLDLASILLYCIMIVTVCSVDHTRLQCVFLTELLRYVVVVLKASEFPMACTALGWVACDTCQQFFPPIVAVR